MSAEQKGQSVKLWMKDDAAQKLRTLADRIELPKTEILTRILAAGLRAIETDNYRFPLPLQFAVIEPENRQNKPILRPK